MDFKYIEEPLLEFANGLHVCPRAGIATYAVYDANNNPRRDDILLGAVGIVKKSFDHIGIFRLDGSIDGEMIPLLLNGADCLVLTSDYEGSPTIIQEALACNLPIVSVSVGDVRDNLRGVRNSYVVNRDISEIANKITEIFENNERSNGNEFVERFSTENNVKRIFELYKNIGRHE